MAIVYPLANGNWSTVANWYTSGATYNQLPQAGDDVYLDGKTISLDTNVTIANLYNTLRSGGTAGGVLNISSGSFNLNSNIIVGAVTIINISTNGNTTITGNLNLATTAFITCINITSTGTVTINGNITGTNVNTGLGITTTAGILIINGNITGGSVGTSPTVTLSNNSRCIITGNVIGGSGNNGQGVINNSTNLNALIISGSCISGTVQAVINSSTGTVTINGNQTATGTTGVYAIQNSSTGIININGDCLGALSGSPSNAYIINNNSNGIVNINGNVIQRSIGPSSSIGIVNNASTGTINVNGNVNGGLVQNSIGISNSSTGTININGSVSGGTHATMTPAIYSTTAGIITVTGNTISNLYTAIYSTNASAIHRLYGNLVSANGIFPIYSTTALNVRISPSNSQTIVLQDSSNVSRSFDTSNVTTGLPAASNVRRGISYGITNQYTGTMYVPTPDNVRKDVLTDNTVGTADLSVDSLINTLTGSSNPMAVRLRNVSTAQITGSQIAGLLNNP